MCERVDQTRASVNVRDRDGFTALILAVKEDNVQCVKELIKAGADLNTGADVNIWEFFGYTPLMLAVRKDHKQCVNELIKAGADVNAGSHSRNTALNEAVVGRNPKYLDLLIKAGADVNQKNIIGDTPLHSAIKRNKSVECLKLLIDAGVDVNIKHQDGRTPLMTAVFLEIPIMVELLIKAGADVNGNNNGKTPLNYAAELESEECLKLLIEAGADVNANKWNPLISSFGYKASVTEKKLEEEEEVSLNHSRYNQTPLMSAACCGFTNSVNM